MPLAYCHNVGKQTRYFARDLNMRPSQSLGFAYCGIRWATLDEVYPFRLPHNICAIHYSQRKLFVILETIYRIRRFLKRRINRRFLDINPSV